MIAICSNKRTILSCGFIAIFINIGTVTDLPLGQVPTLETKHGVLTQSNSIARYVAKKLGELATFWCTGYFYYSIKR